MWQRYASRHEVRFMKMHCEIHAKTFSTGDQNDLHTPAKSKSPSSGQSNTKGDNFFLSGPLMEEATDPQNRFQKASKVRQQCCARHLLPKHCLSLNVKLPNKCFATPICIRFKGLSSLYTIFTHILFLKEVLCVFLVPSNR